MKQIVKSSVIDTGNYTDFDRLNKRYKSAVGNAKKFNRGIITTKTVKSANGHQTMFYSNGVLVQEFYILSDCHGYAFGYVTYKEI